MEISTVEEIKRAEYFFKHEIEKNDFWGDLPEQVQKLLKKSKELNENDLVIPHEKAIEKFK